MAAPCPTRCEVRAHPPSTMGVEEILNECDEVSGDKGSAVLSGYAASPATVSSDHSDSSKDEVLDEEAKQARSRQKGKGRAVDVDATPAATGRVMPQEPIELRHVGDAAHLDADGWVDAAGAHRAASRR